MVPGLSSKQGLYFTTPYRCMSAGAGPGRAGKSSAAAEVEGGPPGSRSRAPRCPGSAKAPSGPSPAQGCRRGGCTGGSKALAFCVPGALVTTSPALRSAKQSKSGGWAVMRQLCTLHPSLGQPA